MPPRIATLTAVFLSISVSAWAAPVYIGGRTNRSWTSGASVSRVARAPAAAPAPAPEPRLARIVPVGYHTAPAAPPPLFKPAPSIESEALGSFFPSRNAARANHRDDGCRQQGGPWPRPTFPRQPRYPSLSHKSRHF